MRAASLRPEIPAEEDDLEQEDRDRAELADVEQLLHEASFIEEVARCITDSSVASAPAISP